MCFAPQADVVGGIVVSAVGIDACRNLRGRRSHLLLATLPIVLGGHQIVEAFVWWGLEGHVAHAIGRLALWVYLLIAFVLLPVLVPTSVVLLEPARRRRQQVAPFIALGSVVAAILLVAMIRAPVDATEKPYHLAYSLQLDHGGVVIVLYVIAVCGPLLFSGYRPIAIFGVANLIAVAFLAWLTIDGFASLWCAYAAVSAAVIAIYMRAATPPLGHPALI